MQDGSHRFLLKVWRDPALGWRALVRDVTDGSLHEFGATAELIEFLASLEDEPQAPLGGAEEGP